MTFLEGEVKTLPLRRDPHYHLSNLKTVFGLEVFFVYNIKQFIMLKVRQEKTIDTKNRLMYYAFNKQVGGFLL